MRKSLITILLLIVISVKLFPQWSTDPNNNLVVAVGWDPHIASDSAGGCYITYNYQSFYPQKLAVERLDKYGYKPWGTRRQILGELPEQWQAEIIEDGEGGVIVSYEDNQVVGANYITRVRVQKVDSNGNFLWGQTGVRVSLSETNHGGQKIISDGDGGCIVVWGDTLAQIRINRINSLGKRLWGDSGKVIETNPIGYTIHLSKMSSGHFAFCYSRILFGFNNNGEVNYRDSLPYRILNITSDESGGAVASWKGGSSNNIKIHSQRKDSLGNNLWQEPYVEIADSLDIGTRLNILSNNNYYHYGWLGMKNGVAEILQIQSLRNNGTKLFIEGSIPLSDFPTSVTSIQIISSYSGSNIFAWTHWDSPQTYNANYARRIDSTGSDLWPENPVLLNEPYLGYFSMVTDCFGGAIGVGYMNSDFAIRALKVSVNGKLGEVITSTEYDKEDILLKQSLLYQNYPNPFNSSTIIKFQILNEGNVNISLYNILGEKLKILSNEYKSAGSHSIIFSSENLTSGVYIYTLETNNKVLSKKLTIIK